MQTPRGREPDSNHRSLSYDQYPNRLKKAPGARVGPALRLAAGRGDRLVKAAEESALWATDLFHLTRVVVENFTEAERIGVIEMLWEVAYSDDLLTGDEDALIRRVAGLIYVSDRDRGEARQRVMQRLERGAPRLR